MLLADGMEEISRSMAVFDTFTGAGQGLQCSYRCFAAAVGRTCTLSVDTTATNLRSAGAMTPGQRMVDVAQHGDGTARRCCRCKERLPSQRQDGKQTSRQWRPRCELSN